jgi:hypothetical protein
MVKRKKVKTPKSENTKVEDRAPVKKKAKIDSSANTKVEDRASVEKKAKKVPTLILTPPRENQILITPLIGPISQPANRSKPPTRQSAKSANSPNNPPIGPINNRGKYPAAHNRPEDFNISIDKNILLRTLRNAGLKVTTKQIYDTLEEVFIMWVKLFFLYQMYEYSRRYFPEASEMAAQVAALLKLKFDFDNLLINKVGIVAGKFVQDFLVKGAKLLFLVQNIPCLAPLKRQIFKGCDYVGETALWPIRALSKQVKKRVFSKGLAIKAPINKKSSYFTTRSMVKKPAALLASILGAAWLSGYVTQTTLKAAVTGSSFLATDPFKEGFFKTVDGAFNMYVGDNFLTTFPTTGFANIISYNPHKNGGMGIGYSERGKLLLKQGTDMRNGFTGVIAELLKQGALKILVGNFDVIGMGEVVGFGMEGLHTLLSSQDIDFSKMVYMQDMTLKVASTIFKPTTWFGLPERNKNKVEGMQENMKRLTDGTTYIMSKFWGKNVTDEQKMNISRGRWPAELAEIGLAFSKQQTWANAAKKIQNYKNLTRP